MADIKVYTTNMCGYCVVAKRLLQKRGIPFQEINVSGDAAQRAWLVKTTGRRTVPQIFIEGDPIGGYDELHAMDRSGELARRVGALAAGE
jgi:glutaredoxin 3